ncbi:MAG: hypothetical protein DMG13_13280 [Acidobacteria bacterium]|nr:MAG: hypothetical protein DMG13_13280 [Acidobacteriota bacterium]
MFRQILVLLLILSVDAIAQPLPPDEINDALSHAEALYFEARFNESIQLLSRVDGLLQATPGRLQEKTNVKLQLALAYIGLNENSEAKSYLRQVFTLNAGYRLDPQQFSPKVMTLAEDAKAELNEVRCQTALDNAQTQLQSRNAGALLELITSMKPQCAGLESIQPDAADLLYKTGIEAYKRSDFFDALKKFRGAVQLSPEHELALQYVELTQSKLQLAADRLLLDWRKNVDTHEFALAKVGYRQLGSFNDASAKPMMNQMQAEYRKTLSTLVQSWKRACASNDAASMETARRQISELLPEPSIGADLVAQTTTCTNSGDNSSKNTNTTGTTSDTGSSTTATPVTAPAAPVTARPATPNDIIAVSPNTTRQCLQMGAQLSLTRLKVRVNPVIPPALQDFLRHAPVTVRVKARIDEKGDVTVSNTQGSNSAFNDAVRVAVERWKFLPTVDQNGPRCVETELPIVLNSGPANPSAR